MKLTWEQGKRPSTITVPPAANPMVRLLYSEMRRQCVTYSEMEFRSGVLNQTFKAWRTTATPSLNALQATLGAVGYTLVAIPELDMLPTDLRDKLCQLASDEVSGETVLGAAILAAAELPQYALASFADAPSKSINHVGLAPGSLPAMRRQREQACPA